MNKLYKSVWNESLGAWGGLPRKLPPRVANQAGRAVPAALPRIGGLAAALGVASPDAQANPGVPRSQVAGTPYAS